MVIRIATASGEHPRPQLNRCSPCSALLPAPTALQVGELDHSQAVQQPDEDDSYAIMEPVVLREEVKEVKAP